MSIYMTLRSNPYPFCHCQRSVASTFTLTLILSHQGRGKDEGSPIEADESLSSLPCWERTPLVLPLGRKNYTLLLFLLLGEASSFVLSPLVGESQSEGDRWLRPHPHPHQGKVEAEIDLLRNENNAEAENG